MVLGLVGGCSYLSHFLQSGKASSSFHGYGVNLLLPGDGITIIVSLFIKLVNSSTLIPHFVILRLPLLSSWLQWVFLKYFDIVLGLVSDKVTTPLPFCDYCGHFFYDFLFGHLHPIAYKFLIFAINAPESV